MTRSQRKTPRYRVRRWLEIYPRMYFVAREPEAAIAMCANWRDAAKVRDALNTSSRSRGSKKGKT